MAGTAGESVHVKYALTPQKGGFLAAGFSHTLNPYKGCAFGRTGCPFCYVRESPMGKFGPAAWGSWVMQKTNLPDVLQAELSVPRARLYRVFMSSATDPYQAAEASTRLSRRCLETFRLWPVAWLVVQTRSLLVQRDFDILAALPFATLNMSVETDLLPVHRRFTASTASPARRLQMVQQALAHGVAAQITVAPLLPHSPAFAEHLAAAVGQYGRVLIDTLYDGDGSGGRRSMRLGMVTRLGEAGFPGWFERCREHAEALRQRLATLLGEERVLWSATGFANGPFTPFLDTP